jgi:signal transduction histidine kinase
MENSIKIRFGSILATAYMILAFGWWSVLLLRKNEEAKQAKIDLLRLGMQQNDLYKNEIDFQATPQYEAVRMKYKRQDFMVLGEGAVLFMGLVAGIWVIHRSFRKEMDLVNQRRNFLLSVTHELKSPLASIQLVLQTLRKRQLEEAQKNKLLQSAMVESDRLHDLVNNLLLSSRLDSAYEPQLEDLPIIPILEDLVEKLRMKFPNAQFQFRGYDSALILRGDRQGLISVFINLLENAVKYAGNQPADISISQSFKDGQAHFEITDKGLGIPDKEKKRVFEKFYRVGNEMTRKTKGTGLGLYIVSQIVKSHQGSIQIRDNKPTGTVFQIVLPNALLPREKKRLTKNTKQSIEA